MAALALLVTAATAQDARHENIVVRTVTSDDGGDHGSKSMTIVLDGEDVSVQVDGKPIPTDRIRWENGKIIILDEHGKDIKILPHLSSTADGTVGGADGDFDFDLGFGKGTIQIWAGSGDARFGPKADVPPPPVMLGVTMVAPSAALRSHLELEEGKSTMVSGVLEGLPADQAGLREFDVIIAINGVREADPASIRAFLQEQQAGDQMDLTVIRQGKRRQVTVTLTAYDADAMRDATYKGSGEGAILQNTVRFAPGDVNLRGFMFGPDEEVFKVQPGQRWFDEAQKRLHGAMPQEKSLDQEDQEWTLEPGEQRLDRRMAEIERMLDEVLEKIQGMKKDEER